MITLLLKATFVLAVLWVFYKLFLERETFFAPNRIYLLSCLALTFTLPFIALPNLIENQGLVGHKIENITNSRTEKQLDSNKNSDALTIIGKPIQDKSGTALKKSMINSEKTKEVLSATGNNRIIKNHKKSWGFWIKMTYLFGVGIFTFHLITQFASIILRIMKSTDIIEDGDYIIINTELVKEPCSFYKYIFINPESYPYDTYEQILAHEKIHVRKKHWVDLLISEVVLIVLWFNPLAWIFRREIEKNLEYQTDDILINGEKSVSKNAYQMSLLQVATYGKPLTLTTNYNQSLIKQRIIKMSRKKSNKNSFWKYAFMIPVVFGIILLINQPMTVMAQSASGDEVQEIESTHMVTTDKEKPEEQNTENQDTKDQNAKGQDTNDQDTEDQEPDEKHDHDLTPKDTTDNKAANLDEIISDAKEFTTPTGNQGECDKLEEAIADNDVEEVKELLRTISKNCFLNIDAAAMQNFMEMRDDLGDEVQTFVDDVKSISEPKDETANAHISDSNDELSETEKTKRTDDLLCYELLQVVKNNNVDEVRQLLKYIDPNCAQNDVYQSGENQGLHPSYQIPLVYAARKGNIEIGRMLLNAGADPAFFVHGEETALLAAVDAEHLDFVKLLVEHGADVNQPTTKLSAIFMAREDGQQAIIDYLLAHGAKD